MLEQAIETRPLGELATFVGGGTPSRKHDAYFAGEIPWATVKDFKTTDLFDTEEHITPDAVKSCATRIIPAGTVLVVTRVGLGKVAINRVPMAINQDVKAVFVSDIIYAEYLRWFLVEQSPRIEAMGVGATVKGITLRDLASLQIPLPPLPEQRRIVDALARADGLVRLHREAVAKTREIMPALFLDMFGDPATNPKGWERFPVESFVQTFEGGKNLQAAGDTGTPGQLRVLKISAVTSGTFRRDESKPVPENHRPPASHFVRRGDLLFSRANTTELVGATAIVDEEPTNLLLPDKLWRFVFRDARCVPLFALALFQNPAVRRQMSRLATGTGGSMKNISQAKLKKMMVPLPPLALQTHFAECVARIRGVQRQAESALAKAQAAFQALLYRAFAVDGSAGNR